MFSLSVLFVSALFLARSAMADEVEDPDVLVLTSENFEKETAAAQMMVVEFYAPWCGHCKRLAPEYGKAATELLKEDPPVRLAKVDATIEGDLASKFGIQGYPTLKIFRNGEPSEYNGPRDAAGIVKYLRAQNGPAAKPIESADALDAFTEGVASGAEPAFVAFVEEGSAAAAAFLAVAGKLREEFRFGVASARAVAEAAGVAAPALLAYRPASFESPRVEFAGAFGDAEALERFVTGAAVPLAGVLDAATRKAYALTGLPRVTVWTRVDRDAAPKQLRYYVNRLRKVAAGYAGKANFVVEDKSAAREFTELGFDAADECGLGAVDAQGRKYRANVDKFSVEALDAFAKDFVAGNVEPHIKSEPIPESQDGDVAMVVVGKQFEQIVHDTNKDVLIEFYAPWCGHCKSLAPKYDELAQKLKGHDSLVIAKIDATANDFPTDLYNVRGFPTIYLQKNDGESAPVAYEGAREVKDMIKWLKKNVHRKLTKSAEAKTEL